MLALLGILLVTLALGIPIILGFALGMIGLIELLARVGYIH